MQKSEWPDGMHPRTQSELANVTASLFFLFLKGRADEGRLLRTRRKKMPLISLRGTVRRIRETTGQSASPPFLGSWWSCVCIFINDLDDGTEWTLSKYVDYTKAVRMVDTPESCVAIQRNFDRLEKRANRNLVKISQGKCKVLMVEEE